MEIRTRNVCPISIIGVGIIDRSATIVANANCYVALIGSKYRITREYIATIAVYTYYFVF